MSHGVSIYLKRKCYLFADLYKMEEYFKYAGTTKGAWSLFLLNISFLCIRTFIDVIWIVNLKRDTAKSAE